MIVVPHRIRDLNGFALLAFHLQRVYGHVTELCSPDDLRGRFLEFCPDALVLDYLGNSDRANLLLLAKQTNARVILLPIAGVFDNDEDHLRTAGKTTSVNHLVDAFLCWGDYTRDAILSQGLATPDKVHLTGCPRFDFYSWPYTALVKPKEELLQLVGIESFKGPLLVWATNTPRAHRDIKHEIQRTVSGNSMTEEEARLEIAQEILQFQHNSLLFKQLAQRRPEWTFIVKVHPLESVEPYAAISKELPNVVIAFNSPIIDFLAHCDVLLQRGCTTASEAWMLQKPVIELLVPNATREFAPQEYIDGNHRVNGADEAEQAISGYLSGAGVPPDQAAARQKYLSKYYYRIDGRSSERCAEAIHHLISPPAYQDSDQEHTSATISKMREIYEAKENHRLINRLKDLLGVKRSASLRLWKTGRDRRKTAPVRAARGITAEMVAELHNHFEELLLADGLRRQPE